jgi:hypothetical protein
MLNMKKIYALLMLCLPMLGFAQKDVTFIVDMRGYTGSYNGVYVNGDYNSWCGSCNPMSDPEGDSIWTATLTLTADSIEYKFTLDGWTGQENLTSGTSCTKTTGAYTNRFAVLNGDTILPGVAWESCAAMPGQVYMTFQVNMSYTSVDTTGVWLAGGTGFATPGVNQMYPIGDSVYSKTLPADTGFYSMFTFLSSNDPGWGSKENIVGKPCAAGQWSDRDMVGYSATMGLMSDFHYRTCFGECTTDGTCPVPATPVNVTFQSDRSNSPSFTTAYISGTMNGWSGDANQMTDADGDGVYDVTLSLMPGSYEFKFTADNWAIQENFDPTTADSVCTLTTGSFTNRFITIGQADTTLDVQCWEECGPCSGIGVDEFATDFSVKPNPASDLLIIENTTGARSTVTMFNITGAKVLEQSFDAEARLDVAAMPRGMYIVRVQNGSTESTVRIALN